MKMYIVYDNSFILNYNIKNILKIILYLLEKAFILNNKLFK